MKFWLPCALFVCAPFLSASSFTNGQAARAEIGQYFFNASQGTPNSNVLAGAQGIAYANGTLFVADGNVLGANATDQYGKLLTGNRVLMFYTSAIPAATADLTTTPPADSLCPLCGFAAVNVLGQMNYTDSAAGRSRVAATNSGADVGSMTNPSAVASDGQMLAVADTANNRVLLWKTIPASVNAPPDIVLGQADFTSLQTANAVNQTTMRGPQGVWLQDGKLFVADTGNNRVMVWNSIPTSNNQACDFVLGQANVYSAKQPTFQNPVTSATGMWAPAGVSSDGTHLFVADLGSSRVLIWNTIPTQLDQPADVVVGQPDMTSSIADNSSGLCKSTGVDQNNKPTYPPACAATLNYPRAAISDGTRLFVADGGNDRVLIFNTIPTSNGASADIVLGQPNFTSDVLVTQSTLISNTVDNTGSADTIATPTSLAFDGTNLYVADPFNRRVLVFTPGDLLLAPRAVVNAASQITRQEGLVTLAAANIAAGDTITITIAGTNYTYTVVKNDTLATITANIIKQINSANNGGGDQNVLALAGSIPDTVYLSSRGVNLGEDTIALAATTSNTNDIVATASGSYLVGGNAATVAPNTIVSVNYSPSTTGTPGLADGTVSSATCASASGNVPVTEPTTLPLALPAACSGSTPQGSVQVFMDGNAVPLFMVSPTQVKALVPYEFSNRSTASVYVRTVHADGSVTVTTAAPLVIAPANPGIFTASSNGNPPPAYMPQHQTGNPSVSITLTASAIQAGDKATVTVNGRAYSYTVVSGDSLTSITNNLIAAINDPQVTAAGTGATGSIVLTAKASGTGGTGIPVSVSVSPASGQTSAQITLTANNASTCCVDNNSGTITSSNPALPNEIITLHATGLGIVQGTGGNPISVPDGVPFAGTQPNSAAASVYAGVGSGTGTVVSSGLDAGSVGVYSVRVQLPGSISSSVAVPIYLAQNAFVSNTVSVPVGSSSSAASNITASPNPIPVSAGQFLGQTTISWNTSASSSVQVRVGSPSGALFAGGSGLGSQQTGVWVTDGTTFYLQDASNGTPTSPANTLAIVTVHLTTQTSSGGGGSSGGSGGGTTTSGTPIFPSFCPASDGGTWVSNNNISFSAQPSTIQVPMGQWLGQTTIVFSVPSTNVTNTQLFVGTDPNALGLVTQGAVAGSASTGKWVTDGTVFWLQDASGGGDKTTAKTLACAKVAVQQVSTPAPQSGTLTASPSTIVSGSGFGQTTLTWNCTSCTSAQIRLGSPSGKLFAGGGPSGSATTGQWVTNGMTFYLVDQNGATAATSTVTVQAPTTGNTQTGVISLNPNPAMYAFGATPRAQTTVTWSCSSCTTSDIRVGSPSGPLFASGFSGGASTTGKWVTNGMTFYLQDTSNGNGTSAANTIATATAQVLEAPQGPPSTSNDGVSTISVDPNPIVTTADFGQATVLWSCPSCTSVQIRVGSPDGRLFAEGGNNGSAVTGSWLTNNMVLYLQDATNGNATAASNTKATVTVLLQAQ